MGNRNMQRLHGSEPPSLKYRMYLIPENHDHRYEVSFAYSCSFWRARQPKKAPGTTCHIPELTGTENNAPTLASSAAEIVPDFMGDYMPRQGYNLD